MPGALRLRFAHGAVATVVQLPALVERAFRPAAAGIEGARDAARSVTATFAALCVVPRLKGKKLLAAKRALTTAHCSVGTVKRVFSSRVRKGRVVAPKPKAGKQLAPGAKVRLEVSKGKRR